MQNSPFLANIVEWHKRNSTAGVVAAYGTLLDINERKGIEYTVFQLLEGLFLTMTVHDRHEMGYIYL